MKKITSLIFAFLMLSIAVPCFAAPSDIAATISQNNFVDIIVWVGIALFALGILFILLSVYLGFKNKNQSDEDYDEYDDDIEIDDNADSEDIDEPSEEDNDDSDSVEDNQDENNEASDAEAIDTSVEEAVNDAEKDTVDKSEEKSEEEPDEKSESEDIGPDVTESAEDTTVKEVKVTLSGLNNSDVKFAVFSDFATLGRKSENDIMISDNAVSGTHCKFTYEDGKVYVEDLNSTNGTMLNDEVVSKSEISNGDTIIIGKCKYRISIYD